MGATDELDNTMTETNNAYTEMARTLHRIQEDYFFHHGKRCALEVTMTAQLLWRVMTNMPQYESLPPFSTDLGPVTIKHVHTFGLMAITRILP